MPNKTKWVVSIVNRNPTNTYLSGSLSVSIEDGSVVGSGESGSDGLSTLTIVGISIGVVFGGVGLLVFMYSYIYKSPTVPSLATQAHITGSTSYPGEVVNPVLNRAPGNASTLAGDL